MRYLAMGVLLAAVAGSAHGQAATWGAFEAGEGYGVGLRAADGSQLMLKCDKPGRNEVYALMLTEESLVPPSTTYIIRPVAVRIDDKAPYDDNWRFYEHYVVAIDRGTERSFTRLLTDLGDAKAVELRLYPEVETRTPVTFRFDVAGAKEALAYVFESCKDTNPIG